MSAPILAVEEVLQARQRIAGYLHRTPLVHSRTFSDLLETNVYLKLECLQRTGSFKPRGAFNKMLTLTPAQRAAGVVAVSGGNHAQGVAYAAQVLGMQATICMPETTPLNYLEATRGYGAQVVLCSNITDAFSRVHQLASEGMTLVHPFDDPAIAAGQGTIGLEILDDLPGVTRLYASIGGGGLIAGIGAALKAAKPDVRIFGVETRGADAMAQSLAANALVELSAITSIARTLGATKVSEFTLSAVQQLVEEVLVVDDAEAMKSLILLLERTKYLTEPAASCTLAAAQRHRGTFGADENIVLLLCGGNLSVSDLQTYCNQFGLTGR